MRKLILLLSCSFALSLSANPDTGNKPPVKDILLDYKKKATPTKHHRSPLFLPEIEAYYDTEAQTLEVVADYDVDATVTLEWNGQAIDYSPAVNASFYIPTPDGLYTLYIEAENWSATGSIEL